MNIYSEGRKKELNRRYKGCNYYYLDLIGINNVRIDYIEDNIEKRVGNEANDDFWTGFKDDITNEEYADLVKRSMLCTRDDEPEKYQTLTGDRKIQDQILHKYYGEYIVLKYDEENCIFVEPITNTILTDDDFGYASFNGGLKSAIDFYKNHPLAFFEGWLESAPEIESVDALGNIKLGEEDVELTRNVVNKKVAKDLLITELEAKLSLAKDIQRMVDIDHILAQEENKAFNNAEEIISRTRK